MLAGLRKAPDEGGFTLVELLVVMLIIGILSAIAIPVFLNQRKKAHDSAGRADVTTLGKEIATYYVDGSGAPAVTGPAGGRYTVGGADAGNVTEGVSLNSFHGTSATAWCVDVAVTGGTTAVFKYSAASGLESGACASGTDY